MNIHFGKSSEGLTRITTEMARAQGFTVGSSAGTEPPRTRDGKTYPGGRVLRRKFKRLAFKQAMFNMGKADGHTAPGSMTS